MCLRPSSSFKTIICLPFSMSSATQSFTLLNWLLIITLIQSHVTMISLYMLFCIYEIAFVTSLSCINPVTCKDSSDVRIKQHQY